MTIEKGRSWGEPAVDPSPDAVAGGDAELAAMAADALERGSALVARVTGGDLLRTIGVSGVRPPTERFAYPIDLVMARLGQGEARPLGPPLPFVAHLTAQPPGRLPGILGALLGHRLPFSAVVMNAAWLGDLRLGLRAHPNDGVVDTIEGRIRFGDRREASRRARSGSHLPHPDLRAGRAATWDADFVRAQSIRLDGVDRGRFRVVRVEVIADALTVVA